MKSQITFFLVAALAQAKFLVHSARSSSVEPLPSVPCANAELYSGRVYQKDEHVIHNKSLWKAESEAHQAPALSNPSWSAVGACNVAVPKCEVPRYEKKVYATPTKIHYEGFVYMNSWYAAANEAPDSDTQNWVKLHECSDLIGGEDPNAPTVPCTNVSPYNGLMYLVNERCTYDGHLYRANNAVDLAPSQENVSWTDLGSCLDGTEAIQPCDKPLYQPQVYANPTIVQYNGHIYRNKHYAGEEETPANAPAVWIKLHQCLSRHMNPAAARSAAFVPTSVPCANVHPYNGGVYETNEHCTFGGHLWRAQWWVGLSPASGDLAWTDMGACDSVEEPQCPPIEFSPTVVYSEATSVHYNAGAYRNRWYADPGVAPDADATGNWQFLYSCSTGGSGVVPTQPATTATATASVTKTTTVAPRTTTTDAAVPQTTSTIAAASRTTTTAAVPSTTTTAAAGGEEQVKPTGPTGPNGECVWPYKADSYATGFYAGVGSTVYQNSEWVGAAEAPGVSPKWKEVATCTGVAPKHRYTDDEMMAMLDPTLPASHLQVVLDPWTPYLPTSAEMREHEEAAAGGDPNFPLLMQARRVLPLDQIEAITPLRASNPDNVRRVETIISESEFDRLFPVRHIAYTYENFLKAVGAFPDYCKAYEAGRDSEKICRKLLAVSFAHFVQETGGNTPSMKMGDALIDAAHTNAGASEHYSPGESLAIHKQALWWLREMGHTEAESSSHYEQCALPNGSGEIRMWAIKYPCPGNVTYYGRGSKQLSWNYNYGALSQDLYGDVNYLLQNPHLVADSWLNFGSAVWFAVTPQSPKPPMTWVVDGTWVPNAADKAAGIGSGFGATIIVINGGVECSGSGDVQVANRIAAYKQMTAELGVTIDADEILDCKTASAFPEGSSAVTKTYFDKSDLGVGCSLVNWQTAFQSVRSGDYEACTNYHHRAHYFKNGHKVSTYSYGV